MSRFFAHSPNSSGEWHDLPKHLRDVAEQARASMEHLSPIEDLHASLPVFVCSGRNQEDQKRTCELFFRLVFSALTDADFLDTEKHFNAARHASRSNSPRLQDLWTLFKT